MKAFTSQLTKVSAEVVEQIQDCLVVLRNGGHGYGAGIIWQPDGLIVTNDHVIGKVRNLAVTADGSEYPLKIWGGAGSSFIVNKTSSNRDKAVQFLKWLSAKEQQAYLSEETKNLPANRHAASKISRILSDFASAMENTTHPTIWPLDEDAAVKEKFDKGIQSIIIGEKTPQEVASEVQKVKTRQMEKKRRRGR